jgi:hypothetical protein
MRGFITISLTLVWVVAGLLLTGCVGFSSYPGLPNDTALNDTNTPAMKQVMLESLLYVTEHRQLPDQFTLNLPQGMVAENMQGLLNDLDDPRASLLSRDTQNLPGLHVAEIRIRGTKAEVDIAAPLPSVAHPDGRMAYETNTLYLKGGLKHWRVTDARRWSLATANVPEPYFIEDAPTIERSTPVQATATDENN